MSRESILVLYSELNDHIVKSNTRFRKVVSVEEQVALTLYYLPDEGRLRKAPNAFGYINQNTSKCQELKRLSKNRYRNVIQNTAFLNASELLTELTYQKNSHQKVATEYITREGSYTVKNEAAADYKYCFVDVMIK